MMPTCGFCRRTGTGRMCRASTRTSCLRDEEPPPKLWREMPQPPWQRKTRFVVGATATQGVSWMESEIFKPWWSTTRGWGWTRACPEVQSHPHLWVWDWGGIRDNPGASTEDVEWYETRTWSSAKERKVRLKGGFENWADSVFDQAG